MAAYKVDELIKEIKVALDENVSSEALISLGDTDTLTLEEIRKSKIEPAARVIETNAPYYLPRYARADRECALQCAERSTTYTYLFAESISVKMPKMRFYAP